LEHFTTNLRDFIEKAKLSFSSKQINIRTIRLNLEPIINNSDINENEIIGLMSVLSEVCENLKINWFNVPIDLVNSSGKGTLTDLALTIIKKYPKSFVNLIVAKDNKIDYDAIARASKFIKSVSRLDNSGYNNFRVGVSCNVNPNTPFFPYTYASKEKGFSIGLEMPKVFNSVIRSNSHLSLDRLRDNLVIELNPLLKEINNLASSLESNDYCFHGLDLSLAPFPEEGSSVAEIIELLGIDQQGGNGTLFVTSYLTDILKTLIKKNNFKATGFNGVMYSLLEDSFMGKRNSSNIYSIDSLISYSSVCGCGLDMVPLPGDVFEEEISSIILDVAALSTVLDKPLGVRLLPIPMKQEHEFTEFNMDFLFNTRIKKVKNLTYLGNLKDRKFFYLSHNNSS
jgi:hypothetical protein